MPSCPVTEPFSSWLCRVDLQRVDGLGELPGAPGTAAELAEDSPVLELGVCSFAGGAELRVSAVCLLLPFRLFLPAVRDLRVRTAPIALIGQRDQAGRLEFVQNAPDPLGLLVVDRAGQCPRHP